MSSSPIIEYTNLAKHGMERRRISGADIEYALRNINSEDLIGDSKVIEAILPDESVIIVRYRTTDGGTILIVSAYVVK